jgi:hypothetical protein
MKSAFMRLPREFPAPSITVFVLLQVLDIFTTWIGMRAGASESSFFIGRLMQLGPLRALLISKIIAVILVCACLRYQRPRVVVFLNYWFTALITWNLVTMLRAMV